jgi:ABC-2 type transport system ATP-binding protein
MVGVNQRPWGGRISMTTDAPGTDTPATDAFGADTPATDTPGAETPGTAAPVSTPAWAAPAETARSGDLALSIRGLRKTFGDKVAVNDIDLDVPSGSFYGLVGPNGAGKTTTLSMATALLRPDAGTIRIHDVDVWRDTLAAKRLVGVLADGVRMFDRLTGLQLITYFGLLCGLDRATVVARANDLLGLLDLDPENRTLVVDYSAGMTKKIALACALVRAPKLLVLDEPFESVDPVSAANIRDILAGFVGSGGTVIVSSHSMDLVQRMCDHVAVIADGRVVAAGTLDEVRQGGTLEDRFVELVGGRTHQEGPSWLRIS